MYHFHFRDKQNTSYPSFPSSERQADSHRQSLVRTVLELVKLVQTGLMLFRMFPSIPEEINGLLCDVTVDGVQRWVMEIGEPYYNLEVSHIYLRDT